MANKSKQEDKSRADNEEFIDVIEGEIVEESDSEELANGEVKISRKPRKGGLAKQEKEESINSSAYAQYILAPILFLLASLLGGLRISALEGEMLFIRPELVCLIFAVVLFVLFVRGHLINLSGWFSEKFTPLKNAANAGVLISLFFASTQIFNSLIPEEGLAYWVISFCFLWTLWNYLFADFQAKRLIKSLIGLFSLAFIVKYLILNNFVSTEEGNWLTRLWNDPTKQAVSYLLDIPSYASSTGYIQFFALLFYMLGLMLISPNSYSDKED